MDYVCLRFNCLQNATRQVNCGTDGHGPLSPVKKWSDYSGSRTLVYVANFNPSTRRVAFDIHVDYAMHKVYVVLLVNLVFQRGDGDAPAWGSITKNAFKKSLRATAGLFDQKFRFTDTNGQIFSPYFFIEFPWLASNAHLTITAKTLRTQATQALQIPNQLPPNNAVTFGTAVYPTARPQPAAGTIHGGINCFLSLPSVRNFNINGTICNPFLHEFGHILGLPDEYDQFPPGGGIVPLQAANNWMKKDKAILYWVHSLMAHNIAVPQWGHFGMGLNQVNEHSLMRDVAIGGQAIKTRHFVSVLEAVEYATEQSANLNGPWTIS